MSRPGFWITAVTVFVVIAFVALAVSNGTVPGFDNNDNKPTGTTLISRPVLPGQNGATSSNPGVSARCKDGTYVFNGNPNTPNNELCQANGGLDQRLP